MLPSAEFVRDYFKGDDPQARKAVKDSVGGLNPGDGQAIEFDAGPAGHCERRDRKARHDKSAHHQTQHSAHRLSLLPACAGHRPVCVRPSCIAPRPTCTRSESGPTARQCATLEVRYLHPPGALAQVRVVLSRSVITLSAPSSPLAGTPRFHRSAAYTRCLRCAGAPRRPASGFGLSLTIPSWHAVLSDPGEFDVLIPDSDIDIAFAACGPARHSRKSRNPFHAGEAFRGFSGSHIATACQVACP
jgi:hypothetical protein